MVKWKIVSALVIYLILPANCYAKGIDMLLTDFGLKAYSRLASDFDAMKRDIQVATLKTYNTIDEKLFPKKDATLAYNDYKPIKRRKKSSSNSLQHRILKNGNLVVT